jgi:hypothetical protein
MPFYLRKIRQENWYEEGLEWLPAGDFPWDPLSDLNNQLCTLSVYEIRDDRSNLERVIAALAATRNKIEDVAFVLFDAVVLDELHIGVRASAGTTPDDEVNRSHRNLIEVSAARQLSLAKFMKSSGEIDRLLPPQVLRLLRDALGSGRINEGRLQPALKARLSSD